MKNITSKQLAKGMILQLSSKTIKCDEYEFLGFTDNLQAYGEKADGTPADVKYQSSQMLLLAYNVSSFKALEQIRYQPESKYGFDSYMVVKQTKTGSYLLLYLYEGRWCAGSSADPVSFKLVKWQISDHEKEI